MLKSCIRPRTGRELSGLHRILHLALGLLAATVASSWIVLAVVHAKDRFRVDFVSGTWMALADYAADGTLYPPLYSGGYFGGTRYMPLPFLLDAGMFKVTGDLLLSVKLVTYAVALILAGLAFQLLRRVNCPVLLALALLAAVLVTPIGMVGTLGVRNDGLAVVLQLAALAAILRRQSTTGALVAGCLAGLAIFAKVSGVWAAVAIALWLLVSRRRRLVTTFLVAFGASVALLAVLFQVLSDGRFLTNVTSFTFAGGRGVTGPLTEGLQALVVNFAERGDAVWLLFPFALAAAALALTARRLTLFQIALAVDVAVLSVVMASRGTDHNHLLDLCVLTVLVVGELAAGASAPRSTSIVFVLAALATLWGVASSYQRMMGSQTYGALERVARGTSETNVPMPLNPLTGFVTESDVILSQDPTIPLALGQRPILLDAFTAKYAFLEHPSWAETLSKRVQAKEFEKIILVSGLFPRTDEADEQFLGPIVNRAILANYRLAYAVPDFYVYLPLEERP